MRTLRILGPIITLLVASGCGRWVDARLVQEANMLLAAGDYAGAGALYADALANGHDGTDLAPKLVACLLAQGRAGEAIDIANEPARLSERELPAVPDHVKTALSRVGAAQMELASPKYTDEDMAYIERTVLYWQAAQSIVRNRTSDRERLLAILDWSSRNIQSGGCAGRPELPAWPLDVMLRGYGACDRSAWVFVALARQLGYRAFMLVLWDKERDVSPHALASVLLPRGLALFDTHTGYHLEVEPDRDFATIDDVIESPGLLAPFEEGGLGSAVKAEFLKDAIVTLAYEPSAVFPRTNLLQDMVDAIPGAPRFYFDVGEDLRAILEGAFKRSGRGSIELRYRDPAKPYALDLWAYPFEVRRAYRDPGFRRAVTEAYGPDVLYRSARIAQLTGNYETAARQYRSLLQTVADSRAKEDIGYLLGVVSFEMGDIEGAVESLNSYLENHPAGVWRSSASYHLARSYEAAGQSDKALLAYRQVQADPISVSARARERALAAKAPAE